MDEIWEIIISCFLFALVVGIILVLPMDITLYRDQSNSDSVTIYGKSNLFDRIFNNECPKVHHPMALVNGTYVGMADTIVRCTTDKRWFYN